MVMVVVSVMVVVLAGIIIIGEIAGIFFCGSKASLLILMCLSFIGSLVVLASIIWILSECASQGDWRAIEDTANARFISAASFSLIVGALAVANCIRGAKDSPAVLRGGLNQRVSDQAFSPPVSRCAFDSVGP